MEEQFIGVSALPLRLKYNITYMFQTKHLIVNTILPFKPSVYQVNKTWLD